MDKKWNLQDIKPSSSRPRQPQTAPRPSEKTTPVVTNNDFTEPVDHAEAEYAETVAATAKP